VLAALTVLTKVVNQQVVMAVKDAVDQLLSHQHEMIRKKAVIVLMKFNKCMPIEQFEQKMKKALCDKDPQVMAASLNHYVEVCRTNPHEHKDLMQSFLIIL
jgi:AP-4 complex subunit epsilon-1